MSSITGALLTLHHDTLLIANAIMSRGGSRASPETRKLADQAKKAADDIGRTAAALSNAWDSVQESRRGSSEIGVGLRLSDTVTRGAAPRIVKAEDQGCGGQARQLNARLQGCVSSGWFKLRVVQGKSSYSQVTKHVVSAVLPCGSLKVNPRDGTLTVNPRDDNVANTAWAALEGLVLDTWDNNVRVTKRVMTLHDFFRGHALDMRDRDTGQAYRQM